MLKDSPKLVQQLRAQAKVVEEEKAKVDALFFSIGEGVMATDEQGRIIRVNQAALNILGYKKSEVMGKWFPSVITALNEDGSLVPKMERAITKTFITGETITQRTYYRRQDGIAIPVQTNVAPILLKGRPVGAVEVFRDISADLQRDKVLTEFVSIASHQLRTPLAAINTYSHMLSEGYAGELDAGQLSFLSIILSATARMNDLINMLLNVTRVEAGIIAQETQSVQLDKLIHELVAEFSAETRERKIKVELAIQTANTTLSTDPILVKEVFSNLFSNAIKYTPEAGKITISLYHRGNNVIFEMKDSGYGIPKTDHQFVFTKFFRSDNILKKDVSGTGLGLYLTKIIVDNLNGELWFKSKEHSGTSFYFSLPLKGSLRRVGKFKLEARDKEVKHEYNESK